MRASGRRTHTDKASGALAVWAGSPDALFLERYREMQRDGVAAPPQSSLWVETWVELAETDLVATMAFDGERPVMALAFDIEHTGPTRTARFMGGTHANGNFPLCDRKWLARSAPDEHVAAVADMLDALRKIRPDIDVVALERLQPGLDDLPNPLLELSSRVSPNVSLAANLGGGFESFLTGAAGKRRRKKYRSRVRRYETAGGYGRIEARDGDDVRTMLSAFHQMKAARFDKAGIPNVFAASNVQRFFEALFIRALEDKGDPSFVLHGLEVGGRLRAVTGSSRTRDTMICEFGSITEDELAPASPGDFLFHENIREACEAGLKLYDFSVGDEAYKRLWCDVETRHSDVVLPLSAKGRLLALGMNAVANLKRRLKANPRLWTATKRLRETLGGGKTTLSVTDEKPDD